MKCLESGTRSTTNATSIKTDGALVNLLATYDRFLESEGRRQSESDVWRAVQELYEAHREAVQ